MKVKISYALYILVWIILGYLSGLIFGVLGLLIVLILNICIILTASYLTHKQIKEDNNGM